MTFIETPVFTQRIKQLLTDDEYRLLQHALLLRPSAGKIIPKSGGLRKFRWGLPGIGKRGGLRTVYYWEVKADTIFLLLIYKKSKQEDLTQEQLKILRNIVKEYLQ
jgi:hypothetical protein